MDAKKCRISVEVGVKTNPNTNPFVAKIGFVKSRGVGFQREPKPLNPF